MKIAVIGSGIAGLSAAWLLHKAHDVTLYERNAAIGMDAFSVDVDGLRLDVPMRLNYAAYYKNLSALYELLEIDMRPLRATATFSSAEKGVYFRFKNWALGSVLLPRPSGSESWPILRDAFRFYRNAPRDLQNGALDGLTLSEYFKKNAYSEAFTERFFLPLYATICTCSYESMRNYPAAVVAESVKLQTFFEGFQMLRHVRNGTQEVVARLTEGLSNIRLNTPVMAVCRNADGTVTLETEGGAETFDHVILATQANHALKLLSDADEREQAALRAFPYESCEVLIHRDTRLAPSDQKDWAAMLFHVSKSDHLPMATGWMNATYPELRAHPPIFHTLNPSGDVPQEQIIAQAWFERPVPTLAALAAWEQIEKLHAESDRRVWFVGAYASYGLALQENALNSAVTVAERLGLPIPWENGV